MIGKRVISAQSAFGPKISDSDKRKAEEEHRKKIEETKHFARLVVATPEFKEFRAVYEKGRESIIALFKNMDAHDLNGMLLAKAHLEVMDDLLGLQKKAE